MVGQEEGEEGEEDEGGRARRVPDIRGGIRMPTPTEGWARGMITFLGGRMAWRSRGARPREGRRGVLLSREVAGMVRIIRLGLIWAVVEGTKDGMPDWRRVDRVGGREEGGSIRLREVRIPGCRTVRPRLQVMLWASINSRGGCPVRTRMGTRT